MGNVATRVCPVERSNSLDRKVRRWIQNPRRILESFDLKGKKVLDFGCGPGFFTIDLASLVGEEGQVTAVDLQIGMLSLLQEKMNHSYLQKRIVLHQCSSDAIGIKDMMDFVLLFYMFHELPNPRQAALEIQSLLSDNGEILLVEPKIHVQKRAFEKTVSLFESIGYKSKDGPRVFFSRSRIFYT